MEIVFFESDDSEDNEHIVSAKAELLFRPSNLYQGTPTEIRDDIEKTIVGIMDSDEVKDFLRGLYDQFRDPSKVKLSSKSSYVPDDNGVTFDGRPYLITINISMKVTTPL